MPRVRGAPPLETYRIKMPKVVEEYLAALVLTGTYGNSTQDAAAFLISKAIDDLIARGVLKRRPSQDPL